VGQGLLTVEDSYRIQLDTPHLEGLLWMSDQPENTQHSQKTDIQDPAGFKPTIPRSEWPQTHALDLATGTGIYTITD